MTPLERAARALFDIEHPPADGIAWEELSAEVEQAYYVDLARAVLQALREPSEGMLAEGGNAGDDAAYVTNSEEGALGDHGALAVWQAMIDRALSE